MLLTLVLQKLLTYSKLYIHTEFNYIQQKKNKGLSPENNFASYPKPTLTTEVN